MTSTDTPTTPTFTGRLASASLEWAEKQAIRNALLHLEDTIDDTEPVWMALTMARPNLDDLSPTGLACTFLDADFGIIGHSRVTNHFNLPMFDRPEFNADPQTTAMVRQAVTHPHENFEVLVYEVAAVASYDWDAAERRFHSKVLFLALGHPDVLDYQIISRSSIDDQIEMVLDSGMVADPTSDEEVILTAEERDMVRQQVSDYMIPESAYRDFSREVSDAIDHVLSKTRTN